MRKQLIAAGLRHNSEACPTCVERKATEDNFQQLNQQLKAYKNAMLRWQLRTEYGGTLADRLIRLHDCLEEFTELFRDAVESHRITDAVIFEQYHTANLDGGPIYRLRKGVTIHEEHWRDAHTAMDNLERSFPPIKSAHADLARICSLCPGATISDTFLLNGLQPLEEALRSVQSQMEKFRMSMQPWLDMRRAKAFQIPLPSPAASIWGWIKWLKRDKGDD